MKRYERVEAALQALGARLKRAKKHRVYELPNGKNFVMPGTPSDGVHGEMNSLRDLHRAAGIVAPEKEPKPIRVDRAVKRGRVEPERWGLPHETSPMAAALRATGLVEQQLRCRIGELEAAIVDRDRQIVALLDQIHEMTKPLPEPRFGRWTTKLRSWIR